MADVGRRQVTNQAVAAWREMGSVIDLAGQVVFMIDRPAISGESHEPLLVLHGFPSCSFDFRHVLPTLAEHRRVVLCDFLGFGLSAKPDVRYSIRMRAGYQLLPRTIRYIEDRRAEERRFTGAIETHPSPVAVVWGDRDPVAVYAMAERFAATRPDAPLVTLDGVGHYPMIEAPERFAEAILEHLDD